MRGLARRHLLFALGLLTAAVSGSCTRSGFEAPQDAYVVPDTQADASLDLRADQSPDVSSDSSASRRLICGTPQEVGTAQPANLTEAAITPDGSKLYAHVSNNYYVTSRATLDAPFDSWQKDSTLWPTSPTKQDPAFFLQAGSLRAMAATSLSGGPRVLLSCKLDGSACSKVDVFDAVTDTPLTLDLDGPSLTDSLDLLISVASSTSLAAIFRARPRDASLTTWDATPLLFLPGGILDDASITRDGSLIVVIDTARVPARLLYTFRAPSGDYPPLRPLEIGGDPHSAEVFKRPDGAIEIYDDDRLSGKLEQVICQ